MTSQPPPYTPADRSRFLVGFRHGIILGLGLWTLLAGLALLTWLAWTHWA